MINKGIYRHFKGNYYEVIDTVRNSESGQEMVLYKNVLMDDLWVRPLDMFLEEVVCNGVKVERFSYCGLNIPEGSDNSAFIQSVR